MNAKLAIVVPVYNRAGIVGATLESIKRQSLRPLHVVLVNNKSSDDTDSVLRQWKAEVESDDFVVDVIFCSQPGAAAARNAGFNRVSEPWVMFFDSDDTMEPDHCQTMMENTDNVEIVGRDVRLFIDGKYKKTLPFYGTDMHRNNLFHGAMATLRWCARTDLVRRAGCWDSRMRYWDDIELGARMLALSPALRRVKGCGVRVNFTPESVTGPADCNPQRIEAPLSSIEYSLSRVIGDEKARNWVAVKAATEYALCTRAGSKEGALALEKMQIEGRTALLARIAYLLTRFYIPGAARLLRPFIH